MPKFGQRSLERLGECDPRLQRLFSSVVQTFDCTILVGFRDEARQTEAYTSGRSDLRWPDSLHNREPSLAVDVAPYWPEAPHVRWGEIDPALRGEARSTRAKEATLELYRWILLGGFVLGHAAALGLEVRWGGDWNRNLILGDQRLNDYPHFEVDEKPASEDLERTA